MLVVLLLAVATSGNESEYLRMIDGYLTFNGGLYFFSFLNEWIQFPICLAILVMYKNQRGCFHYSYLAVLVILSLFKFICLGMLGGSLGNM